MDRSKEIITNVKEQFIKQFGDKQEFAIALAPGRVNLIGDHTDYNDGYVLPMTIDRAVYVALAPRQDNKCIVYSMNFDELVTWEADKIAKKNHHWSNYLQGVMQILLDKGYKIGGFNCVMYGDVPIGAGLSSSAAVEVATLLAFQHAFKLDILPIDVVKLAQRAENNFIGVQCGIMDQFVSRLGIKDHALFIDCRTLDYKEVPIKLGKYALLIIDTKVKRELAKSAYNERRASCEEAVKYFQAINPNIKALRDVSLEMLQQAEGKLPATVYQRARHVVTENQRVLDAMKTLSENDLPGFGKLLYEAHNSIKNDYAVSCKELDFIVDTAKASAAIGARLTGAGFGGCALVIIDETRVSEFMNYLSKEYQTLFEINPEIMILKSNLESGVVTF
jgi:galactokinase